jgi:adenylate kinase family enzyme
MIRIFSRILWRFRGVQVFALVGKSGTGKSFRARLVMEKYGISLLIDDGLLIEDQRIIAGKSAKKEDAYMAAVRTALFTEKTHRRSVRHAVEKSRFKRILILGTSDRMIMKICKALKLPEPKRIIRIEEIATAEEIRSAINHRTVSGRHVIPVPSIEVRRNYPRVMGNSIKVIWRRGLGLIRRDKTYEKTVVQPAFSTKGTVTISEAALTQMIMHCIAEQTPGLTVSRVSISSDQRGYRIDVHVKVPYRLELKGSIYSLQQYIVEHVERFTGILIDALNIVIDNVTDSQ